MVLLWNDDPSKHQDLSSAEPMGRGSVSFSKTPRFVRDGSCKPQQLNPMIPKDTQGLEVAAKRTTANTSTHTIFQDTLANAKATLEIASEVERSLWSLPSMRSENIRQATERSLLANDTRYDHLKQPYKESLGPGHYWVEGGLPSIGTYPPDLPSRSSSPMRNPDVPSAAFVATQRPEVFPPVESPDWYLGTEMPIVNKLAPWCESSDKRAGVPDYRYSARYSEARKEVPYNVEYTGAEALNMASDLVRISDRASPVRCNHKTGQMSFATTEPRLAPLPRSRINDMRLSRKFTDDDSSWLGPGAYEPMTSVGGPKRKSYKMFNPSTSPPKGSAAAQARALGTIGARSFAANLPARHKSPSKHNGRILVQGQLVAGQQASSSFTAISRHQKCGPFSWSTDSALTRTL